MPSNNRQNHDFQIAYFLAGKCHTPDGAWSQLCDLEENRVMALAYAQAHAKREKAKEITARRALLREDEAVRLEAEADLIEIANNRAHGSILLAAAESELAFIRACKIKLEPLRKYAHLPDSEAHEAAQREEWCLELICRVENHLATGPLPAAELDIMRCHPDFQTRILPEINRIEAAILSGKRNEILSNRTAQWSPLTLEAPQS